MKPTVTTAVLDVRPMLRASEKAIVERVLGRQAGVERVEANPVAQTATVSYDPARTSLEQLRQTVEACGYHCGGQSVPAHVCDPAAEPGAPHAHDGDHPHGAHPAASEQRSPQEVMGHGGHGGMSMAAMVADMRNRFLVAIAFAIPIVLWSKIGRDVIGFTVAPPFGLREDVWQLLLSLPVVFYASSIFFTGAVRAARPHAGHDGARRGRGRLGLAVFAGGDADRWREVFYEAAVRAGVVRAAGALVRDAGARRRQRCDPHAAEPGPGQGAGRARRPAGRGLDRRGPGRRPADHPAGNQDRRRRGSSRTATARSTSRWSPARACRCTRRPARR